MADEPADGDADPASHDESVAPDPAAELPRTEPPADPRWAPAPRRAWRRTIGLTLAFLAPTAVIAVGVFFIIKGGAHREPAPIASTSASSAVPPPDSLASAVAALASSAPPLEKADNAPTEYDENGTDDEPTPVKKAPPKHFATVQAAAAGSCSTESVDGLSRQIIEQARCIKPNDFVALPKRPNLMMAAHVYPYLEVGARDHLLKALDAHSSETMTINSCLRTLAQQYLVSHWAVSKICGVQLATPPGESNHEIGTALDIAEAPRWRKALEAQEFRWLGASDRVHFDYKGTAAPHTATDVLAFQKLWNRNHHDDPIAENGQYTSATEQRLKKAPPGGFPLGASCQRPSTHTH